MSEAMIPGDDSLPDFFFPDNSDSNIPDSHFEIPDDNEPTPHDDLKTQLEESRRAQDELKARLDAMQAAPPAPAPVQHYTPAPVPAQHVDRAALAKQLSDQFYADPGQAMLNMVEMGQQLARQEIRQNLIPVAGATVRGAIQSFRGSEGMPAEVLSEFDDMIKSIPTSELANIDPSKAHDYLGAIKKMAYGQAAMKGTLKSERMIPPNLGGGGRAGGSRLTPGKKTIELTPAQQRNMALAKEQYGFNNKELYQMLKDGDLD